MKAVLNTENGVLYDNVSSFRFGSEVKEVWEHLCSRRIGSAGGIKRTNALDGTDDCTHTLGRSSTPKGLGSCLTASAVGDKRKVFAELFSKSDPSESRARMRETPSRSKFCPVEARKPPGAGSGS